MFERLVLAKIIFKTLKKRFSKPAKFDGTPEDICKNILAGLWNGSFYQTGLAHFDYFWVRDFGTVTKALVDLGEREKVHATIHFALTQYQKAGKITTCITKRGQVFDTPMRAIGSLPWFLHAIASSSYSLSSQEKHFLEEQLTEFVELYIDPHTGLPKPDTRYTELRDSVVYKQSAYTVTMLASLVVSIKWLGLPMPGELGVCDYKKLLEERYWNGSYFKADIENNAFSAEGALMPFFLSVIDVRSPYFEASSAYIQNTHLIDPYPMRYTDTPNRFRYTWWTRFLMPGYAADTIWPWHGAIYLNLLAQADSRYTEEIYQKLSTLLEVHKTFPELLHTDGSWYARRFYQAESGMVWAAVYLVHTPITQTTPKIH